MTPGGIHKISLGAVQTQCPQTISVSYCYTIGMGVVPQTSHLLDPWKEILASKRTTISCTNAYVLNAFFSDGKSA